MALFNVAVVLSKGICPSHLPAETALALVAAALSSMPGAGIVCVNWKSDSATVLLSIAVTEANSGIRLDNPARVRLESLIRAAIRRALFSSPAPLKNVPTCLEEPARNEAKATDFKTSAPFQC